MVVDAVGSVENGGLSAARSARSGAPSASYRRRRHFLDSRRSEGRRAPAQEARAGGAARSPASEAVHAALGTRSDGSQILDENSGPVTFQTIANDLRAMADG